jgi:hypothetical protein
VGLRGRSGSFLVREKLWGRPGRSLDVGTTMIALSISKNVGLSLNNILVFLTTCLSSLYEQFFIKFLKFNLNIKCLHFIRWRCTKIRLKHRLLGLSPTPLPRLTPNFVRTISGLSIRTVLFRLHVCMNATFPASSFSYPVQ